MTIVIKIGGSILGDNDTSLQDIVHLAQTGKRPVIVHGGGAMITDWLDRLNVNTNFVNGLRATNSEALEVVIAILRGVVNTTLVAQLTQAGGRAVGISGVDNALIQAEQYDPDLGLVGKITKINNDLLSPLLDNNIIPVIAPIGIETLSQPLNINADTVAGEIAASINAEKLVFLTDVAGILDESGSLVSTLTIQMSNTLKEDGTLKGGMIPKVDAGFIAARAGTIVHIINGTIAYSLQQLIDGNLSGTTIRGE
ncbi:MAG: acetylglutamate kinase [Dehalococcoidia bacterium]|nr:acetylglutamate kinase [Dehalococcoidia bacterium]